ncbi:ZINC ION BINDING PROTEIN [Salix koriyanagi]|uniref:ZINC ION BINDING PROTEIN n=1 Tax=Salix koriyanagi TaxID=2511006 RepID=A0A9Q1AJ53_9ROSI|nr:ZINC ION BINDING PROTEIN [Salix koriyanagi]
MAKGITGTGQGFDLPGRCLGGFSRQPPLSSLRPSALAATENRARRDALLPSDVQVVAAILRLHLAQHKLLPWLLKGDYTMTCGTSPSPQTASLLLKELLDILQAQVSPRVRRYICPNFTRDIHEWSGINSQWN